tara:strand:- start:61 stop:582 length:522 start_codon:yes stop_codon:yes gene_type:complete
MKILLIFFGLFILSYTGQADEVKIFEFENWIHRSDSDHNIDIVYNAENPYKSVIFVVDPSMNCDGRMVYTNAELEENDLSSLDGEKFEWQLSGVTYKGENASKLNTKGYIRFELISFYKHHFEDLEELLAPHGVIGFSVNDPLNRFEPQSVLHKANGLSRALSSALDTCQGWT